MTRIEVDLLTDQGNDAVVRLPGRSFPGVLLQGDSLHVLLCVAKAADEARRNNDAHALEEELAELLRRLEDARDRYEGALAEHNIPLPYPS